MVSFLKSCDKTPDVAVKSKNFADNLVTKMNLSFKRALTDVLLSMEKYSQNVG